MKIQEQKYINFRNAVMIIGLSVAGYVLQMLATIPCAANPMALAFFSSPFGMIVGGSIFVLVMNKAPYRGTLFLYTVIPSIMLLFMGTPYVVLIFAIGAMIGEMVFYKNNARTPMKLTISYIIYAIFWGIGTYTPAMLQKEALLKKAMDVGGAEVMALYDQLYSLPYICAAIVVTALGAILGVYIGSKIFKKHFVRAGV